MILKELSMKVSKFGNYVVLRRSAPFSAYLADKPHPELFTNFMGKKVRLIREYIRYVSLGIELYYRSFQL